MSLADVSGLAHQHMRLLQGQTIKNSHCCI